MSRFALLSVAVALLFPMSAEAIKLHLSPNVAAEACDYLADGDNKQAAACYQRVRSDPVISAQLVEWHRFQKHLRLYGPGCKFIQDRSEEHTSELQSLMRNTSAVFC